MSGVEIDQEIGGMGPTVEEMAPVENPVSSGINLGFLKAPTGEGSVEMYLEHPLNFNGSKSMARVIRGCTGMFGALDLAIVDITIGALDHLKTKKAGGQNVNADNGVYPVSGLR